MKRLNGLRDKRKERKLTRAALSKATGVSAKSIYQYEIGECFPRPENWEKLTGYFQCGMDELI